MSGYHALDDASRRAPLVVLSWGGRWGRALTETVARPFEERTGVRVQVVTQVGLGVPVELERALATGERPPFDVVWSGISAARRAADAQHTVPLEGRVKVLRELRDRALPEGLDGAPFVQPYVVYYVLVHRKDAALPSPRSWADLEKTAYRGRVALYPKGNGFFPVAQLLGGGAVPAMAASVAPCWLALRRLRSQVGLLDYSPNLTEPLRRGDITLAFRTLPNALGFCDEGVDVAWSAPDEGVPETVDALWIPTGHDAQTVDRAAAFVDFALSAPVQRRWCASMGTMPVHPAAGRPEVMDGARLPRHADDREGSLYLSELVKYRHEAAWAAEFDRIMSR